MRFVVLDVGTAAETSASTTRCPAVSPDVICTSEPPTTPTPTRIVVTLPAFSIVTVCSCPMVCSADTGTVSALRAVPTSMTTLAPIPS